MYEINAEEIVASVKARLDSERQDDDALVTELAEAMREAAETGMPDKDYADAVSRAAGARKRDFDRLDAAFRKGGR